MTRRLVVVLAAGLLAGAALAASAGAFRGHRVYVADGGVAVKHFRPRVIFISADSSFYVARARYAAYNGRIARGHGVSGVDNCLPNCAVGHVFHNRVRIRLSHPTRHCGRYYYDTLRLFWPHRKPPGLPRHDKVDIAPATCRR